MCAEAVAGYAGYVDQAAVLVDRDVGAVGDELAGQVLCAGLLAGSEGREGGAVCDGEVETEVFNVAGIVLELELLGTWLVI